MKPDEKSLPAWPFDQPRNCAAISTRQVIEGREEILAVYHDLDDHGWQFMGSSAWEVQDGCIVALSNIVYLDPSVLEIADLPPGWSATRTAAGKAWTRSRT